MLSHRLLTVSVCLLAPFPNERRQVTSLIPPKQPSV